MFIIIKYLKKIDLLFLSSKTRKIENRAMVHKKWDMCMIAGNCGMIKRNDQNGIKEINPWRKACRKF